jgi:DNA polymerase III subunit epsilon
MRWLERFLHRKATSTPATRCAGRFVVIDTETSGLDVTRDRLLAIGGVAVSDGAVDPSDSFYAVLRQPAPTLGEDILIHRIGTGEQSAGDDPAAVLRAFAAWCDGRWAAGFHSEFDRRMLERACREYGCAQPAVGGWIDLAVMAPLVLAQRAGTLPRTKGHDPGLDTWLAAFGIDEVDRHNALGDAVATAALLLAVLKAAPQRGLDDPPKLAAESRAALQLRSMR